MVRATPTRRVAGRILTGGAVHATRCARTRPALSQDPLRQPLLASTTGRKQVRQALALSLNILKCMGDYPSKRTWREYATAIIQEGITNEDLRDELLCQVVKQVINNQRRSGRGANAPAVLHASRAHPGALSRSRLPDVCTARACSAAGTC